MVCALFTTTYLKNKVAEHEHPSPASVILRYAQNDRGGAWVLVFHAVIFEIPSNN
jgi:hypothetical protein